MGLATGRLRPLHLVRLASLGLERHMRELAALWYCQQCRQCSAACPMEVSPASIIRAVRREAVRCDAAAIRRLERHEALSAWLQRARWRGVSELLKGRDPLDTLGLEALWRLGEQRPSEPEAGVGFPAGAEEARAETGVWLTDDDAGAETGARVAAEQGAETGARVADEQGAAALSLCMTCSECSTVCPVAHERDVFDPLAMFRMAALGLRQELFDAPGLWLCLGCGMCSEICAQGVDGRLVIQRLQQAAVREGRVPADFLDSVSELDRALLRRFREEIDTAR